MPPPPPPPPAPAPPPPKSLGKPDVSPGGVPRESLKDELERKRERAPPIVPRRPPTPVDRGPEKLYNVTFDEIDTLALFNALQFGSQLLVIDVRPVQAYRNSHIRSAISVDWSQYMGKAFVEVEKEENARFMRRRTYQCVLYDDGGSLQAPTQLLNEVLDAFTQDQRAQQPVAVLKGGLAAFERNYPFMVKGNELFLDQEFPSEIVPDFMFLGSWATASNREALKRLKLTHIVNATDVCDMPFQEDFEYLHCPLDDSPEYSIGAFFESFMHFVNDARRNGGRLLVHCKMGMSRSSALAILYVMVTMNMTLKNAADYVRERRRFINPNPGFLRELGEEEHRLRGTTTIRFPQDGKPITVKTIYEWLQSDGTWKPRTVTVDASPSE